jgi:microcystin-dependent protein
MYGDFMRTFHIALYLLGAIALTMLISPSVIAQTPNSISYQGVLTDNSGQPLPDGSYQMKLRLYDAVTGGTIVWRDEDHSVQLVGGVFSTTIGGAGEQPLPPFDRPYWLGVTVGAEAELSPRTPLTSVPYSHHAQRADTADHVVGGVPVGTVMAFAGSEAKVPAGWMICDGRAVSSTQLPALYNAIDTAWGNGSDDTDNTTNFNLPDLRGQFLRGVDTSSAVDPDAGTRYARKSGGAVGAKVGSYQDDANTGIAATDPFAFDQSSTINNRLGYNPAPGSSQSFTSTGGVETRPRNAAVHYIIRVR